MCKAYILMWKCDVVFGDNILSIYIKRMRLDLLYRQIIIRIFNYRPKFVDKCLLETFNKV